MRHVEIEIEDCPSCSAPIRAGAHECRACGARKRRGNWLLHGLAFGLWAFTFALGVFVLAGVVALIKHVPQDYTLVAMGLALFALSFASAWWLSAFNTANKIWQPRFPER